MLRTTNSNKKTRQMLQKMEIKTIKNVQQGNTTKIAKNCIEKPNNLFRRSKLVSNFYDWLK